MTDADEQGRYRARTALEDSVYQMLEAGYTKDEVKAECDYALENADDG